MSFTLTNEPSGFALTTISPNSSGVCQSALRPDRVGEFLSAWDRFAADLPGRIHRVLLLHRGDDVRHGDAELASWSGFTHNRIAYWPAPNT